MASGSGQVVWRLSEDDGRWSVFDIERQHVSPHDKWERDVFEREAEARIALISELEFQAANLQQSINDEIARVAELAAAGEGPRTRVVNVCRDVCDVYIGRTVRSRWRDIGWGNPFKVGKDGTREEVIEKYHSWIQTQPQLLARLPELKGRRLGCWCAPEPCHGDVLAELAERGVDHNGEAAVP